MSLKVVNGVLPTLMNNGVDHAIKRTCANCNKARVSVN